MDKLQEMRQWHAMRNMVSIRRCNAKKTVIDRPLKECAPRDGDASNKHAHTMHAMSMCQEKITYRNEAMNSVSFSAERILSR
jgi:hypothetical protein